MTTINEQVTGNVITNKKNPGLVETERVLLVIKKVFS